MLWTIAVIFFILWVLGLVHVFSIGAWLWLFLAIWVVSVVAQLATGRRRGVPPPSA